MKEIGKNFIKFITSRIFILLVVITGMFCFLIIKLFDLQIVNGERLQSELKTGILREISIPAPRGCIYDKYGRPLAINNVAYAVKIDSSVKISSDDMNNIYINMIRQIENNEDTLIYELPISSTRPYTFLFDGDEEKEIKWKETVYEKGITVKTSKEKKREILKPITAEQIMEYLVDKFSIPKYLSDEEVRKLVSVRYSIYLKRYRRYDPVTIALDVSEKTVAVIEEENEKYPGVYVDTEALRIYPEDGLFSHIIGYIRSMDEKEAEKYKNYGYIGDSSDIKNKSELEADDNSKLANGYEWTPAYNNNDIIGKTGLEKSQELVLNGKDGKMYVEVDNVGRRKSATEDEQPESGKDIYLNIDRDLQEVSYNALHEELKKVLLLKLDPGGTKNTRITLKELFTSMVNANKFSIDNILKSDDGSYQYFAKKAILNKEANFTLKNEDDDKYAKQIICDSIQSGELSSKTMILIMHEQKMITGDDTFVNGVAVGALSPLKVIKDKIIENEITPQDTALDPCTGSVVVTDVNTGKVLSMVSYPTYDNNQLVNKFNNEYFKKQNTDTTSPFLNRPLMERKAPGSILKMVTALAGLQEGVIGIKETIYDRGIFDKAGKPEAKCLIYTNSRGSHGSVNVTNALEVSCNYFFYETSYRMGNTASGNKLNGIETLDKYMELFGLNSRTGVEIDPTEEKPSLMASPEYRKNLVLSNNPDATDSQIRWTDGQTIRAAIGQSDNNFTAAGMSKYVATLANGGTRYEMQMINKIRKSDGEIVIDKEPVVEEKIDLKSENLKVVYEGMLAVTKGSRGTLKREFADYPIKVAAKSGTAQEDKSRDPHTVFVGFAPYDNPQISISVMIPFGHSTTSAATEIAKTVIASYMGIYSKSEMKTMDNVLTK